MSCPWIAWYVFSCVYAPNNPIIFPWWFIIWDIIVLFAAYYTWHLTTQEQQQHNYDTCDINSDTVNIPYNRESSSEIIFSETTQNYPQNDITCHYTYPNHTPTYISPVLFPEYNANRTN